MYQAVTQLFQRDEKLDRQKSLPKFDSFSNLQKENNIFITKRQPTIEMKWAETG
jgi:hypothetical protein